MPQDITATDEQYLCDECGYTSPVANEHCPDCGSLMSALHEEKPKAKVESGESDEELTEDSTDADGASSLEALQSKEQEESDQEYQHDAFGG